VPGDGWLNGVVDGNGGVFSKEINSFNIEIIFWVEYRFKSSGNSLCGMISTTTTTTRKTELNK